MHERLLHPRRGLYRTDDAAYIPEILRLGVNWDAQRSFCDRSDWQRARLHGCLSESFDAHRDQLFYCQPGSGRSSRFADLSAADGPLGRHGDLVSRIKPLQDCALFPGKFNYKNNRNVSMSLSD